MCNFKKPLESNFSCCCILLIEHLFDRFEKKKKTCNYLKSWNIFTLYLKKKIKIKIIVIVVVVFARFNPSPKGLRFEYTYILKGIIKLVLMCLTFYLL